MNRKCIFTGHRDLPPDVMPLRRALMRSIVTLAEGGFPEFLSGGAVGFDLLAAETVLDLKKSCPGLRLTMILPCRNQDRSYSAADKARYRRVLERADEVHYTAEDYYRGCMLTRDRVLAGAADYCICYLTRSTGGTAYTVRQAALRGVPICNLAEDPALRR